MVLLLNAEEAKRRWYGMRMCKFSDSDETLDLGKTVTFFNMKSLYGRFIFISIKAIQF